jgi:hypothetical protein
MKFLRYTVLVILMGLSTAWADLSSELRAETENGLCGETPSARQWQWWHDFSVMLTVNGICRNHTSACVRTTKRLRNTCTITEWSDVSFTLRLDRENSYLHESFWHRADANIKCLVTSDYIWECLYLSGNFTYRRGGNDGQRVMPFNIQEKYLGNVKEYVDANLADDTAVWLY